MIAYTFEFLPSLLHVARHVDEEVLHLLEAGGEDAEGAVVIINIIISIHTHTHTHARARARAHIYTYIYIYRRERNVLIRPHPQQQQHHRLPRRPRPELPPFVRRLRGQPPRHDVRHVAVRPQAVGDEEHVERAVRQDQERGSQGEDADAGAVEVEGQGEGQQALQGGAEEEEGRGVEVVEEDLVVNILLELTWMEVRGFLGSLQTTFDPISDSRDRGLLATGSKTGVRMAIMLVCLLACLLACLIY